MKGIDDDSGKRLYWWNRNYFFAGTIVIVLINILVQACVPDRNWFYELSRKAGDWYSVLSFQNLLLHFLSAFIHFNWQHTLLNMLCFLICGGWLERRKGTFALTGLVFVMAFMAEAFAGANDLGVTSFGFSGVNYGLYAYAIVDYIALLCHRDTRTKANVISGAILMALIYFAACFSGGTGAVRFEWYPYDFIHNMGHYSGFFAGLLLALTVQAAKIFSRA